jgi:hypothetical protein
VTRKLETLVEAIADGLRSDGRQAKLDALESRKKALEQGLTDSPAAAPRLHPNLAGLYRRKVTQLHEALADPSVRDEALGILRGLIEAVVHPEENGFTPDSCSRRIPIICSSVNLLRFIVRLLVSTDSTKIWKKFRVAGHPKRTKPPRSRRLFRIRFGVR